MPLRPSPLAAILALSCLIGCNSKWEVIDLDGDGYNLFTGDCDEGSAEVNAAAAEIWYNGFDENCDGNDGDQDGDGVVPQSYADGFPSWDQFAAHQSAGDCWDDPAEPYDAAYTAANGGTERPSAATVNPAATEVWYDGVDQDCSGGDDFDQDADGYQSLWHTQADGGVGDDCVDGSDRDTTFTDENGATVSLESAGFAASDVHPGAADDACYDAIDADCAENSDFDCDGDGYDRGDECDDEDAAIYPNPNVTEVWYNGIDENCDGNDGDQDGDGYVPASVVATYSDLGLTWEDFSAHIGVGDCWDDPTDRPADYYPSLNGLPNLDAADVHPNAPDVAYDGVDADCLVDSDFDNDNDGEESSEFEQRDGSLGPDCDDGDAAINTGATEDCSTGADDNCDGSDNDANAIGCVTYYYDNDRDNYGTTSGRCLCEAEGNYRSGSNTDCNDNANTVYPGATEVTADGIDQDCNSGDTCYYDADNDDYGSITTTSSADLDCTDTNEASNDDDCDDTASGTNPGASEIVADGINQDCSSGDTCYSDTDRDGYGSTSTVVSSDLDCTDSLESANDDDCNDSSSAIRPSATETIADGIDQDCSGGDSCYVDSDGDTYGSSSTVVSADLDCTDSGESRYNTDCNTSVASIYPGAAETVSDGIDQDCDTFDSCYQDSDSDGYGSSTVIDSNDLDCSDSGESSNSSDCNTSNASINPGAAEVVADGIDQNCNGGDVCYQNLDTDSYGTSTTVTSSDLDCSDSSEASNANDCYDAASSSEANNTFPGAASLESNSSACMTDIDGDNYGDSTPRSGVTAGTDCLDDSGSEGLNTFPGAASLDTSASDCMTDIDGDNYGDDSPHSGVTAGTDCDDSLATISPGDAEICDVDDTDEDCDGAADDSDPEGNATGQTTFYTDADSDGYGVTSPTDQRCDAGGGFVANTTDCDDTSSSINPGANDACTESVSDTTMIDDDCDGIVDEGTSAGTPCYEGGELAFSEIMYDSSMSTDTDGEYFEVYNATAFDIDMMGMRIRRATTTNATFYVSDHIVVPAGDFVVFCYSDATLGALCDYEYGSNQGLLSDLGAAGTFPSYSTSFNLPDATATTMSIVVSGYGSSTSEMNTVTLDSFTFTGQSTGAWAANAGISVETLLSTVGTNLGSSNDTSTNWVLCLNTGSYLFYDTNDNGSCGTSESCEYGTPQATSSH